MMGRDNRSCERFTYNVRRVDNLGEAKGLTGGLKKADRKLWVEPKRENDIQRTDLFAFYTI